MVLTFNDKTKVELVDESTTVDFVTVLNSFAAVDKIKGKFTEDNLKGALFGDKQLEGVIPIGVRAEADPNGNVTVHFMNRIKTEIELMNEEMVELQNALLETSEANTELQDAMIELSATNSEMLDTIASITEKNSALEESVAALLSQNDELKNKLDTLAGNNENSATDVENVEDAKEEN